VPSALIEVAKQIRKDRETSAAYAHALRNCPLDEDIPLLDQEDPLADKYAKKTTFVAEAFLQLFRASRHTPLLSYGTRQRRLLHRRDLDQPLSRQADRVQRRRVGLPQRPNRHPVRADFITLLGMRCPDAEITYTGFVPGPRLSRC